MRSPTLFCLLLALVAPTPLLAQATGRITGVVTSETGAPLSGVQVSIPGTRQGSLTGADGRFTITGVAAGDHRMQAQLVGYSTGEATASVASGQTATANFQLRQQAVQLQELVAVGYGTQRRVNVSGAVASVSSSQLTERPVARITEALQGSTPGLTVIQRSAQPGRQWIDFNIRGRGTLNNTSPLVLIDGVPGDINQINVQDIDNVAVLKDAGSAAIYGARAANGVVLVTTKRGSNAGGLRVTYDGYYGIQGVANFPKTVGPRDYMELINEAAVNAGLPPRYNEEFIRNTEKTYRGEPDADPIQYPWTNWLDELFDPAPIQDHTLSIAGGSDIARFNLSLNYFDHQGMTPQTAADRIGLRLNTDYQVNTRLQTGVDLSVRQSSDIEPFDMGGLLFRMFHDTPPWIRAKYPDGTYGWSRNNHNPLAYGEAVGRRDRTVTYGSLNGKADYELFEGLTIRTMASAQASSERFKEWRNQVTFRNYFDPTIVHRTIATNRLNQDKDNYLETYLRAMGEFNRAFGPHQVTAILGYDQTAADWDRLGGFRENFYNNDLQEINAGDAAMDGNRGSSYQWRLRSGFGRLGYTLMDRYILEANARYDGSSRFAPGNRFGFFPSFSAAWRLSEEPFFRNSVGFINELKFRASWGRTGNQDIVFQGQQLYYPYYSTVSFTGHNYIFGDALVTGGAQTALANRDISWEGTEMSNLGVDLEVLGGRLAFTGDVYRKTTDGILLRLPIPNIIGFDPPVLNAGVIRNTGWETAVNWRDRAGAVDYSFGFNLSDNKNTVVSLAGTGPYIDGRWITQEGLPLGTMWGYEALGLFRDQAEVDAHAQQPDPLTGPGDIKFKDQNNDGIINADDRVAIGNDLPRYLIGSNLSLRYRGFDASAFFQGVLKVDAYIEGAMTEGPVWENFTTSAWLDRWTPQNPNPNARMPKPALNRHHNHGPISSFWVQDTKYLKLKSAQLGYTLPASAVNRIGFGLNSMRVYLSGQNLLTFTGADLVFDPEFPSGRGTVYPQTRTVSLGTSIQF